MRKFTKKNILKADKHLIFLAVFFYAGVIGGCAAYLLISSSSSLAEALGNTLNSDSVGFVPLLLSLSATSAAELAVVFLFGISLAGRFLVYPFMAYRGAVAGCSFTVVFVCFEAAGFGAAALCLLPQTLYLFFLYLFYCRRTCEMSHAVCAGRYRESFPNYVKTTVGAVVFSIPAVVYDCVSSVYFLKMF